MKVVFEVCKFAEGFEAGQTPKPPTLKIQTRQLQIFPHPPPPKPHTLHNIKKIKRSSVGEVGNFAMISKEYIKKLEDLFAEKEPKVASPIRRFVQTLLAL